MEMKHGLHLSQRPALIMTQRLQQARTLLQVPPLELPQILQSEITQNPLLAEVAELVDTANQPTVDGEERAEAASRNVDVKDEIDGSEWMQDDLDRTFVPPSETATEFFEKVPIRRESLSEHLTNELHLLPLTDGDLALGEILIC